MKLYTDWSFARELLKSMEREFFNADAEATREKLEQIQNRAAETAARLRRYTDTGWVRLTDLEAGGGYSDILKGLSAVERLTQEEGEAIEKTWGELHFLIIKLQVHAWAQQTKAYCRIKEIDRGI